MGTVLSVKYVGKKSEKLEKKVRDFIKKFEKDVSFHKKESYIGTLNSRDEKTDMDVPHYICRMIEESLEYGRKTEGAFDITYKTPLKTTFDSRNSFSTSFNFDDIVTDCKNNTVSFKNKNIIIDMGGIAKGYSLQFTKDILMDSNIKNFIVNYGGDIFICGKKGEKPWKIGIKNPDKPSEFLKVFEVENQGCTAIATSGDYERYIEIDGEKHSHIINPETGRSVKDAHSVTVKAKNPVMADMLATAISVRHDDKDFIEKNVDNFSVKVYTLSGRQKLWREYGD
ncbi:MAG: FAD:protein FMN transferase [bacterium]